MPKYFEIPIHFTLLDFALRHVKKYFSPSLFLSLSFSLWLTFSLFKITFGFDFQF